MKKYYKQGSSIFGLDFTNQKMICVTDNLFNKGIVISEGMSSAFEGMANSFSSSLSEGVRSGFGEPTLESTEDEFTSAFNYALGNITSASLVL
jgi:hypothetical protein